MPHDLPLPRNVVEIPIYVYLCWRVWPPIQLLLGVPYRDLDDRFSEQRLLKIDPALRKRDVDLVEVFADIPDMKRRRDGAQLVISSGRPPRRGPHRTSSSVQSIVDIGMSEPTPALAWMCIWRDLGIIKAELGTDRLRDETSSWHRVVPSWETKVRKQRQRITEKYGDNLPEPSAAMKAPGSRVSAVVCARGAAACCGGPDASALCAQAFARYAPRDADLAEIELPHEDFYRYHHDVRSLAPFFSAPGAPHADYSGEVTHVVVPAEPVAAPEVSRITDL
jgi:hypothetical protein